MKFRVLIGLFLFMSSASFAQKAWLEVLDGGDFAPDKEVKLYIDVKACDCQLLIGTTDPVYIWTWAPGSDDERPADLKNGQWGASNTNLEMTNEGNDVWSYTMIPTDFYNVSAEQVYENDFSFLAKSLDGGSGGGCDEFKTDDVHILVDPPVTVLPKVYSFPFPVILDTLYTTDADVFTLVYNNAEEEKVTMQNLDEAWVYLRGTGSDSIQYKVASLSQIGNNPQLQMKKTGSSRFQLSFIPRRIFTDLPPGVTIRSVRMQIVRWPISNLDDVVDGEFIYRFRCE